MKKSRSNNKARDNSIKLFMQYLLAFSGITLAILLPLVMKDGYSQIDTVKFQVYKWIFIVGYGVTLLLAICSFVTDIKSKRIEMKQLLSVETGFLAGFVLVTILSTLLSAYRKDCIFGCDGWFMGLFSQLSFVILYLLYRYSDKFKKVFVVSFMGTAFITAILGVLNRLDIDPLDVYRIGTYQEMPARTRMLFLSTIGQATWFSSYLVLTIALGMGIYILASSKKIQIITAVFLTVSLMSLITQNSDSAYISLLAMLSVYFCFSLTSRERLLRFADIVLMLIVSTRLVRLLFYLRPDVEIWFDSLTYFIIFNNLMWIISAILIIGLILFKTLLKKKDFITSRAKLISRVYMALLGTGVLMIVLILILDANNLIPESVSPLIQKLPYLHWSEFWGSGRGKTWTFTVQMFMEMSPINKLLGVGPDAYGLYAYDNYARQLTEMWPDTLVMCAHNEWLNALINLGIFGVIFYAGIFIYSIIRNVKLAKTEPAKIIVVAAIMTYICHNFFCYQQVCCTPFIFIIMGL